MQHSRVQKMGVLGFFLTAIFICPILLLVGCSRATSCPPGKACIRYMTLGNPEQLAVERQIVNEFNEKNPDLFVKLFTVPSSSYGLKMTTMLVSHTAPDVLRVDHFNFPALQEKNYFLDLTPFANSDPGFRTRDFVPLAVEEGTVNGHLYGLNTMFGPVILFYNKSLFRKAGLEDPYTLSQQGRWTWDQFRQDAIQLTKFRNERPIVFGTDVPPYPLSASVIWSYGGDLLTPDGKTSVLDSPGTVAAYQFLADLIWKDHVAPTPAQGANSAFTFESGKLAMSFNWIGMTAHYRGTIGDFDWDICPLPTGPKGLVSMVKGNQIVIAANSKNPKAAWRFIRFLSSSETETKLFAILRRGYPTRLSVSASDDFLKSQLPPYNTKALVTSIQHGRALPINDRWAEWQAVVSPEIDNLLSGRERSAKAALQRAKAGVDKVLAEKSGF